MVHTKHDTLPSVTQIVWEIYPFPDFVKERWINSVNKSLIENWKTPVAFQHLMTMTQSLWDMMHNYFLSKVMQVPVADLDEKYSDFQKSIDDFILERNIVGISSEVTIEKPDEYIGHYDLVCEMDYNWERITALCDLKTYQSYKHILGISHEWNARPLLWNKSKVSLQLSMYRNAMIEDHPLFCFHLTPQFVDCVPLPYSLTKYEEWKNK